MGFKNLHASGNLWSVGRGHLNFELDYSVLKGLFKRQHPLNPAALIGHFSIHITVEDENSPLLPTYPSPAAPLCFAVLISSVLISFGRYKVFHFLHNYWHALITFVYSFNECRLLYTNVLLKYVF